MSLWQWLTLTFTLGFIAGFVFDDAYEMFRDSMRRKEAPVKTTTTAENEAPASQRSQNRLNYLGIVMVVMTLSLVLVTVLFIFTLSKITDYSQCTSVWQQQFGQAYTARVAANEQVDSAMDDIVFAVASDDKEDFAKAVNAYVAVRAKQDAERIKNPVPPLPEVLCGDPIR